MEMIRSYPITKELFSMKPHTAAPGAGNWCEYIEASFEISLSLRLPTQMKRAGGIACSSPPPFQQQSYLGKVF